MCYLVILFVSSRSNNLNLHVENIFGNNSSCNFLIETVLLVTSSRRPENWIVPGGGVEPEEEASVTATREVLEEAGVIGKLGRSLGVFENLEHKDRTEVYVMTVTEELDEWEDSKTIGRKRQWFTIEEALEQLALHKPVQRNYIQQLRRSKLT
ncbi:hypothetical protein HHI36_019395 [Cryptolaemus montrouzieri]|uniref:diphosphoinositol-polyphosphate diphosphatase n=1 Tax=Cryptolaemus montrouzieri TaxID=559131 RepID=A0ABD2P3B2_9CUCU